MNEGYPLYPQLTEEGKEEAQKIMDGFKNQLTKLFEEILRKLYTDVSFYVESDHWTNYRNTLMDGFKGYGDGHVGKNHHKYDYKDLREAIYRNNKEEMVKDLNQDLAEENDRLKKEIERLYEDIREMIGTRI